MKINNFALLFIVVVSSPIWGQGIFESAGSELTSSDQDGLEIGGYVRSTAYINRLDDKDSTRLQSGYGEITLQLSAEKSDWAKAFADVRFRAGYEINNEFSALDIREAYLDLFLGDFDIRLGKQVVVWGRADGFNPTNNITPQNTTVRSPESDDIRKASFLLRTYYNISPAIRLEGIWEPVYSPTVLAVEFADLPPNIFIGEGSYPDARLKNGLWAGHLSLEYPAFDGSLSYVQGYNPMPGIKLESLNLTTGTMTLAPAAYRQQVVGFDFSTTLGSWGFRGEGAWRIPDKEHNGLTNYYIPYEDIYFVFGIDRTWGDFNIIAQYIGRFIPNFEKLVIPTDLSLQLYSQLENYNRLFVNQTDQWRHAISFRPAISLFYETLSLEVFGLYDLTTSELMIMPKLSYKLADALSLSVGGNLYYGDDSTLNDLIHDNFSAVFCELRVEF